MLVPTWVALSALTTQVPPSKRTGWPGETLLVAFGVLIVRRVQGRGYRFSVRSAAARPGDIEAKLLAALHDALPVDAALIGWDVNAVLVPSLLEAASTAPPAIAHRVTTRLHHVLRRGVNDVAMLHRSAAGVTLHEAALDMAISAPQLDHDTIRDAWASDDVDRLRTDATGEALALWRMFCRGVGIRGITAEEATDRWVAHQQSRRMAHSAVDTRPNTVTPIAQARRNRGNSK